MDTCGSPARVVWSGNARREGDDLAVLAIDRPVAAHFAWSDGIPAGEPVVGAGPDYDHTAPLGLGLFSGTTLNAAPSAPGAAAGRAVFHTGPVHLGDSGGPLATAGGRLIAINVGDIHELNVFRLSYRKASRAHRPDLDWLRRVIEQDFAARKPAE